VVVPRREHEPATGLEDAAELGQGGALLGREEQRIDAHHRLSGSGLDSRVVERLLAEAGARSPEKYCHNGGLAVASKYGRGPARL
jgi:hypothetical protein